MNIVILGAGKVGSFLTEQLANENHDILVIEQSKVILNRLLDSHDIMGIVGDGRDIEVLKEANVDKCDIFIAITMSDDVNIIASTLAKSLGAKNIIIRLRDPIYIDNDKMIKDITSSNLIINPEFLAAKEIQRSIKYSHARNVENFMNDHAMMLEIIVGPNSMLKNRTLIENERYLKSAGVLIGIINDQGEVIIPKGNTIIREGQKIYIFGIKENVDNFYKSEVPDNTRIKNVLIIGASATAYQLTDLLLERKFNVTVIEIDRKKAIDMQEKFPAAVVIHADGSDPDILDEIRIDTFEAVVSLTGIDEENILIALVAEKYGIDKIVAKVNRTNLLKITGVLDIDATFTPKRAASNYIHRLIRSKEEARDISMLSNLYRLEEDQVEVLEFMVSENSELFGHRLKELSIRKDTLIAAIDHQDDGNFEIANGDSVINAGDRVLIITKFKDFTEVDDMLE